MGGQHRVSRVAWRFGRYACVCLCMCICVYVGVVIWDLQGKYVWDGNIEFQESPGDPEGMCMHVYVCIHTHVYTHTRIQNGGFTPSPHQPR
jgi:hypothetical protein